MTREDWVLRLAALVERQGRPGRPLYLYVDRDVLAETLGDVDPQEAVDQFCRDFQAYAGGGQRFRRDYLDARLFDVASPDVPPFVVGLAMTVLAVTESPIGGSHGVYPRQNQLLGYAPEAHMPPGYDDHVPYMWARWNAWLRAGGARFGTPTAKEHPHWTQQGWARSQGFIRRRERALIGDFFEDHGLQPGDSVPGPRLLSEFLSWMRYRPGSTGSLLTRVEGDEQACEVVVDVLEAELEAWTGERTDVSGRASIRALLSLDDWTDEASLAVPVTPDLVGTQVLIGGEARRLEATDPYLVVPFDGPVEELLGRRTEIPLGPRLVVTCGGEPVYVMADTATVGGQLQQRRPIVGGTYDVLVSKELLGQVLHALRLAGAGDLRPEQGPADGWSWLHTVRMTQTVPADAAAALGALVPQPPPSLRLSGGLQVASGSYLDVGPPDLMVPAGGEDRVLLVDGQSKPVEIPSSGGLVAVQSLLLEPGDHLLSLADQSVGFRLEPGMREAAGHASIGFPVSVAGGLAHVLTSATDIGAHESSLTGALLTGVPTPSQVFARVPVDAEVFVLTEEGELRQVSEDVAPWLRQLGLGAPLTNVARAVRGIDGSPAFLLWRQAAAGRLHRTEIPHGTEPDRGRLPSCARPDLVKALMAQPPHDVGRIDRRRWSKAFSQAFARAARSGTKPEPTPLPPPVVPVLADDDVRRDSAFDDALRWLSELEGCATSTERFRETWTWLAGRAGADVEWRLALHFLQLLGHVEIDYRRGRVGTAPAVANVLTNGRGYAVLCGSRPERLMERLVGDDDRDPHVQEASSHWDVHVRAQQDDDGRATGPAAVYLEWDPQQHDVVSRGLVALGVTVSFAAGDRLLDSLQTMGKQLSEATLLTLSPSRDAWMKKSRREGWVHVGTYDSRPGLYRYRVHGRMVFAWRDPDTLELRVVDRQLGLYLLQHTRDLSGSSQSLAKALLRRDHSNQTLRAPRSLPLPPLVARALVLRCGVLPRPVEEARPWRGETRFLDYLNVDVAVTERLVHLLGQPIELMNH